MVKPAFVIGGLDIHSSLPVLTSSATSFASSVLRKSLPSYIAAPRLMMPQQTTRGVSGGYSNLVFQICLPVSGVDCDGGAVWS